MKIPRPDEDSKEFFKSIIPDDPRVTVRPMFGNVSAFVNGNMFMGLFGADMFLRLSDENREELLEKKGATVFEPMKGRPMKDYVLIPKTWRNQPEIVRLWVSRSLDWASKLPKKKAKR
jgi:TfoX/Sxy family transcriptional regulator of competence genes